MEISRTRSQGSIYRRGDKINKAESRGRNAGLGDSNRGSETARREIARENIWKYEAGKGDFGWNEDVQESIKTKKLVKRTLDKDNNEENKAAYKTTKKEPKKTVAITKVRAYDHLYADMDTIEGQNKVLRMAKEREKNWNDIYQSKVIKDEEDSVLVDDLKILQRWEEYCQKLMNEDSGFGNIVLSPMPNNIKNTVYSIQLTHEQK